MAKSKKSIISKKGKTSKWSVPKDLEHAYKMLVQRANRRVKANLKYIEKNKITDEHTKRALVRGYEDKNNWAGATMPFSRSKKGFYITNADTGFKEFKEFGNKAGFERYLRELERFGKEGGGWEHSPDKIVEGYKKNIIKSLNQIKDQYNITLPGGKLPQEIIDELDSLTLEQITNFYSGGSVEEDIEISQFDSDDYIDVTGAEGFIDVTLGRIAQLKKYH